MSGIASESKKTEIITLLSSLMPPLVPSKASTIRRDCPSAGSLISSSRTKVRRCVASGWSSPSMSESLTALGLFLRTMEERVLQALLFLRRQRPDVSVVHGLKKHLGGLPKGVTTREAQAREHRGRHGPHPFCHHDLLPPFVSSLVSACHSRSCHS